MPVNQACLLGAISGSTVSVSLIDTPDSATTLNGSTATARITYKTTGTVTKKTATFLHTWLLSGLASQVDIKVDLVSGNTPSGTLATWLPITSDRAWSLSSTSGSGIKSCTATVRLRDATTLVELAAPATMTLYAEWGNETGGP